MIKGLLAFILLLATPSLREIEEKYLVISPMRLEVKWMTEREFKRSLIASPGVTEMGYDNKGKPVISNEALLGLANALLFETTVGSIVYTIWTHSPTAGIVSLGLTYASYRVIRKAL